LPIRFYNLRLVLDASRRSSYNAVVKALNSKAAFLVEIVLLSFEKTIRKNDL
jgi:hypothetical protein